MFKKLVLLVVAVVLVLPLPAAKAKSEKEEAAHVLAGIVVHNRKCPTPQTQATKDFGEYLRDQGPFDDKQKRTALLKVHAQINKVGLAKWCSGMDLAFTLLKK